jgi:DNA primase small subunit
MLEASVEFLKKEFFKYYYENLDYLVPPPPIKNREFGFFLNKDKGMIRHRCFNSLKEFHEVVLSEVPLDIYVSAARYEDPGNRDMAEKKLIDAELFFDIDAEPSRITPEESAWICPRCGKYDLGFEEKCPACNWDAEPVETVSEEQLSRALGEVEKLVWILINDFGISEKHISVFFSGNRGYHVHVDQEGFTSITAEGRREIVDYLLIQGLDEKWLPNSSRRMESKDLMGMRGRIYKRLLEILGSEDPRTRYDRKKILRRLDQVINELRVRIDPVVTIDTHRLMRMPHSINSNSGMVKKEIRLQDLHSFKPLKDAIAFGDEEVVLRAKVVPRFKLGGRAFGPFKDEEVEIPVYAAIYIICKGLGEYVRG